MRSHEQSLQRLGLPRVVPILLIRDADAWSHGPEEGPSAIGGHERRYKALEKLRAEKAITGIGIGVNDPSTRPAICARATSTACCWRAATAAGAVRPCRRFCADRPAEGRRRDARRRVQLRHSRHRSDSGASTTTRRHRPRSWIVCAGSSAACADHGVPLPVAAMHFSLRAPPSRASSWARVTPDEVKRNVAAISAAVPRRPVGGPQTSGLLDRSVPTPVGA